MGPYATGIILAAIFGLPAGILTHDWILMLGAAGVWFIIGLWLGGMPLRKKKTTN